MKQQRVGPIESVPRHPPAPPNGHDELGELRSLLLGPEQAQLAKLRERLDNPKRLAEDVSRALPEAIFLRTAKDQQLATALAPTIEGALTTSVRKDPRPLVAAIAPVMGPAIRRAIAQAFRELTQSLNHTLERSFSKEGLSWRIEAWRTGRPFSEVVLSHTLLYRVEQIFLIHRKTGLLLQHLVGSTGVVQDADMVSSMLTAIRDFVQDSFGTRTEEGLDNFQVGELTVIIEQGTDALLAAVVRGTVPHDLRMVFQTALENVHLDQGQELRDFHGDAASFEKSRRYLEDCLRMQTDTEVKQQEKTSLWPLLVMSGVLTTVMLVWLTLTLLERWRWEAYLVRLKAEPGIVVVSTDKAGGKHIVRGLRDPLAADPVALLQQTPIPPHQVIGQWEPYQSLAPTFILARAHAFLAPPEGVTLHFADGILSAVGVAPAQWISEARKLARAIAGVTKLNEEGLLDADAQAHALKVKELQAAKETIERHVLYFVLNSTDFVTPQDQVLASLVATFQTLVAATHFVGYEVQVDVVGYTDRTGLVEKNRVLGQQRAERVVAALVAQGLTTGPGIVVRARGGNLPPEQGTDENLAADRRVTFVVTVTDSQKKPR